MVGPTFFFNRLMVTIEWGYASVEYAEKGLKTKKKRLFQLQKFKR